MLEALLKYAAEYGPMGICLLAAGFALWKVYEGMRRALDQNSKAHLDIIKGLTENAREDRREVLQVVRNNTTAVTRFEIQSTAQAKSMDQLAETVRAMTKAVLACNSNGRGK